GRAKAGRKLGGGLVVGGSAGDGAMVIAHEHVLNRMSAPTGKIPPAPPAAWPTDAYPRDTKDVYANSEGIALYHPAAAHSDGDSVVYFRRSDVIVAGDIYSTTSYPVIDTEPGGRLTGVLEAVNHLSHLAMRKDWPE